jgi:hypothetical protein
MPLRPEERRAKELADAIISAMKDSSVAINSLRGDLKEHLQSRDELVHTLNTIGKSLDAITAESRAQSVDSSSSQRNLLTVQWWLFGATTAAFLAAVHLCRHNLLAKADDGANIC